ncbi:hypothetical protein [Shewanella acanthi]|nr:hypothetical protein [Shewanella acanthi]
MPVLTGLNSLYIDNTELTDDKALRVATVRIGKIRESLKKTE